MTDVSQKYRAPDGQPLVPPYDPLDLDIRIVLDVRLCERHRTHGQACRCPGRPENRDLGDNCGRIGFREVGEDPWIDCACGHRFNTNYSQIGRTPWPEPLDGEPLKVPMEGLRP